MKRNHLHPALSVFAILIAMIACVLPSRAAQSAPTPNANAIETAIVSTIQAATATAQVVATKTPGGMTGTSIEKLPDGKTKYTDYDAGFEVTYPVGWLAVRPNSDEFNAALTKDAAVNSMLHDQMEADVTTYNAKFDRLYAYIVRPDLKKNYTFGFSNLQWDSEDASTMDSVTMGKLVRELESSGEIPGFRADTVQLHEGSDVKTIEIGGHWMMGDGQGGTVPFYSTMIFFKPSSNSLARLAFTFLEDYHIQIYIDILSIMESIKVIGS